MIEDTKVSKGVASLARYQLAILDQHAGRNSEAVAGYKKFVEEAEEQTPGSDTDLAPYIKDALEDAKWKIPKLELQLQILNVPKEDKLKF